MSYCSLSTIVLVISSSPILTVGIGFLLPKDSAPSAPGLLALLVSSCSITASTTALRPFASSLRQVRLCIKLLSADRLISGYCYFLAAVFLADWVAPTDEDFFKYENVSLSSSLEMVKASLELVTTTTESPSAPVTTWADL